MPDLVCLNAGVDRGGRFVETERQDHATAIFARAGMLDTFIGTRAPKDSPEVVARDGIEATLAGRRQVVPGSLRNAVQAHAARFLPTPVTAFLAGKQAEPGTG